MDAFNCHLASLAHTAALLPSTQEAATEWAAVATDELVRLFRCLRPSLDDLYDTVRAFGSLLPCAPLLVQCTWVHELSRLPYLTIVDGRQAERHMNHSRPHLHRLD